MTRDEKVRIAKALERLRVDVIEAGFAVASPGDFEAVKACRLSSYGIDSMQPVAGSDRDIEVAAEAIVSAKTSDSYIHRNQSNSHEAQAEA